MCVYLKLVLLVVVVHLLHKTAGFARVSLSSDEILLKEVSFGDTVVLNCRSNDVNHNFEYWLVNNNGAVVGPANENYDKTRYNYEILTGNLIVRGVSKDEEGIYSCISRAVEGNNIKLEKIKMVLKPNDSHVQESHIDTIKILIVLITLVLLGIGGYVIFRMWRDRIKYSTVSAQDEDEDTADEIFQSPTTSRMSRSRSPGRIVLDRSKSTENLTDFKSFLDTANGK